MAVRVIGKVGDDLMGHAWELYYAAFRELNRWTVQNHLMPREAFEEEMRDPRIDKYLAVDDRGGLVGLATYTNIPEAAPLISKDYLARRWPAHSAGRRIWICGFVAVPGRAPGAFSDLVTAMYRHAEEHGGVIVLDVCQFNIDAFHLDRAIRIKLNEVSNGQVRCEAADAQTYHIFETAPEGS